MGQRLICGIAAAALLALTARPVAAWHDRGHMAVALIGYRQLNDAQQEKIQAVLKEHPHYQEFLSAKCPQDAPLEEWIVMRAATWPDWIREHHKSEGFNQPYHHYVNLAIKRLDGASPSEVEKINQNIAALPAQPSSGEILKEFPKRLEEVRNDQTKAAERAIALCWVLHMIGDIHQPLHAVSLFTKDSPEGDRGGNLYYVPWQGRAVNLHFLWDGIIGWDEFSGPLITPYAIADLMARDFQHRHPVTDEERGVATIQGWANESRDLCDRAVYSFEGTQLPIVFVLTDRDPPPAANMAPLPKGYAEQARTIAEQRVTLAGYRLGERLKDVFP